MAILRRALSWEVLIKHNCNLDNCYGYFSFLLLGVLVGILLTSPLGLGWHMIVLAIGTNIVWMYGIGCDAFFFPYPMNHCNSSFTMINKILLFIKK